MVEKYEYLLEVASMKYSGTQNDGPEVASMKYSGTQNNGPEVASLKYSILELRMMDRKWLV